MFTVDVDYCLFVIDDYLLYFFFFKQKTAYEMRISDWSSDVCSSDLGAAQAAAVLHLGRPVAAARTRRHGPGACRARRPAAGADPCRRFRRPRAGRPAAP